MTMARTIKLYKVPDVPQLAGMREMKKEDVPRVHNLVVNYLRMGGPAHLGQMLGNIRGETSLESSNNFRLQKEVVTLPWTNHSDPERKFTLHPEFSPEEVRV